MNKQIQIKSSEILEDQFNQFKKAFKLSPKEQTLIEKYSNQIKQIIDLNNLPESLPNDLVNFIKKYRAEYIRILREFRRPPRYEVFSDIQFQENKASDPDNGVDLIKISARSDESQESVTKKLQDHLKAHCWWLQDYWREKGVPKEQFTITTEVGDIQIYNFSEVLTERHLQELEGLISFFTQASDQSPLKEIRYILLDNNQPPNPNTGEEMNGYGAIKESAVKLYPRGQKFMPHRISRASNFEGTVIHELSHKFSIPLRNDWSRTFGWKMLESPVQLPGGAHQHYKCESPERCVSEYAKISPDEDLCESMVAAIKAPDTLDPERLAFIKEKIFGSSHQSTPSEIIKQNRVTIPSVKQPVVFQRKEPLKMKINKTT